MPCATAHRARRAFLLAAVVACLCLHAAAADHDPSDNERRDVSVPRGALGSAGSVAATHDSQGALPRPLLTPTHSTLPCPNNCSGRGTCENGRCFCHRFLYYDGPACNTPYNVYLGTGWWIFTAATGVANFAVCCVALYNLVARVRFAEQRRASMRRPKRVCCDLLLRISVATVIGMAMKTALVVDPFGSLHIFSNGVRTCLVRGPEILGCLCLGFVVQVWASVSAVVMGRRHVQWLSYIVNGGILLLVCVTLPAYFLMFIGVQPLIMTWIAVTAFIIFAMCWFAGCILWSFRAVSVLKASLAHATRRDQLKRFDTMLRRSVVFSRCAMALSLLLVVTLLGFTVGAVGPGNYPWWFIVYMLLLHTVCETGFGALFCYFTLPVGVTTKRPRSGAPVRDYIPESGTATDSALAHPLLQPYTSAPAALVRSKSDVSAPDSRRLPFVASNSPPPGRQRSSQRSVSARQLSGARDTVVSLNALVARASDAPSSARMR